MSKFLVFIILIPMFAALGHDVYIFIQNPDKGMRISDVGALWDKYHKESHDQWKIELQKLENTVSNLNPMEDRYNPVEETYSTPEGKVETPAYAEGFSQTNEGDKPSVMAPLQEENSTSQTSELQHIIGILLEQSAILVAGGFALIIFILNALFSTLFRTKAQMSELDKLEKMKRKKKKRIG